MAKTLPKVDVVLVGFGWTGAIMAQQLCDAGLTVLALERAASRTTPENWASTFDQDELRYMWRHHLFQNVKYSTLTFRNTVDQTALPMRRLGSFLPGSGVGGSGIHWNGQIWRWLETDFRIRSHNEERYGKGATADLTIQDMPVSYAELEPYYNQFDLVCGTSGKAGNLQGAKITGGNVFEGPRSAQYPTPPLTMTYAPAMFGQAAAGMGLHPFPHPAGNLFAGLYQPARGAAGRVHLLRILRKVRLRQLFQGDRADDADPLYPRQGEFRAAHRKRSAEGGAYTRWAACDRGHLCRQRRPGVLSASAHRGADRLPAQQRPPDAAVRHRPALRSRQLARALVGKNYCYQTMGAVEVFYDDKNCSIPFIGAGALASGDRRLQRGQLRPLRAGLHRRLLHRRAW